MENTNAQSALQELFSRYAAELKDALAAFREAESEVEFELAMLEIQRIAAGMELSGA